MQQHASPRITMKQKAEPVRRMTIAVPESVAQYFEERAASFAQSTSAAASPVLCAMARGEIRNDFTQQPGTDLRPR